MTKKALITGVTGQDGAYLAEFLLDKGYEVHGIKRRTSLFNTDRIDHLYQDPHETGRALHPALRRPDRLAPASSASSSRCSPTRSTTSPRRATSRCRFEEPEYTANSDALGALRLLEAIRILGLEKKTRFYQASTSRALRPGAGDAAEGDHALLSAQPLRAWPSSTPTGSRSTTARPTACTPATASCSTTRAPMRGETFVTRKITRALARIKLGLQDCLYLGNLDAKRDWGHATRLRRDAVADAAAGQARGLRHRHRRCSTACASSSTRAAEELGMHDPLGRARASTRRAIDDRSGKVHRRGRSALLPPHRSRDPARRRHQGHGKARLDAEDQLRRTGRRDGARGPRRPPSATNW